MSDQAEGAVADAGRKVQKGLNQAGKAQDQLAELIRENPISAALLAVGCVGSVVIPTSRDCGQTLFSPPCPQPKTLALCWQ